MTRTDKHIAKMELELKTLRRYREEYEKFIKSREIPFTTATIEGKVLTKSVVLFDADNNVVAIIGHRVKKLIFKPPLIEAEKGVL